MTKKKNQHLTILIRLISSLFLTFSFLRAEILEMNLVTLANYASQANNINILISDELKEKNFVFIINNEKDYMLEAFRKALNTQDLQLAKTEDFYYVEPRTIYKETARYRAIKLNFVKFEDIANFLKVYEENIKFEFIKTSKTLLIKSNEDEYKSIFQLIKAIDTLPKQLKLKVTIIDTNLEKLKEHGSDSSALNLSNNTNFFFNLISYPFQVTNTIADNNSKGFYSFLRYLDENSISELKSSPFLTLSDEKESILDVVDNLAFKTGTVTIDETDTKTTSSFEYKDVGTKIVVTPHIYEDESNNLNVYIDLELNVSNVISNNDNLPTTSKKYIKQSFHLPTNKLFILTGINKKEITQTSSKVPILSDIPALGWLFKYDIKNENKSNLTIVFELINEKDYTTDNFKILVTQQELNSNKKD